MRAVFEQELWGSGYDVVAGVDEVGRGALAGPVVAGVVVLSPYFNEPWLERVRDSKELRPRQRQELSKLIQGQALASGVGLASVEEIDKGGILPATRLAMERAISGLTISPQYLLIDYLKLPRLSLPQRGIVHGDRLCLSIACASIVAKVSRDRMMVEVDVHYPGYSFAQNKGYATPAHLQALGHLGPCSLHRYSFAHVGRA